ncbi:MAG: hypothetical protein WBZ36_09475, partial [Candidatus Nitrosopolaris sp.]
AQTRPLPITNQIKLECAHLVIKRDELCIIADREQQYFKGAWHDVPKFGIDMLIIGKEGVVEQLAPYADEDGIALLDTRGLFDRIYFNPLKNQKNKDAMSSS